MMYIAAGYVTLDTGECRSLKEKRSIVNSLIGKTRSRFTNAAISEVGNADNMRKARIGVSLVSNDQVVAQTMLSKTLQFLEDYSYRTILDSRAEIFALN